MTPYKKIAITTGDRDGIGFEVAAKALSRIPASAKKNCAIFFLFRHQTQEKTQPRLFRLIDKKWRRITVHSLAEALSLFTAKGSLPDNALVDLSLLSSEAMWVFEAALACKKKTLTSLVTGPLSKKVSAALPGSALGHTGIFRQLFPSNELFMAFIGKHFNVILATDHQPLNEVESLLKSRGLAPAFKAAKDFRALIRSKKKIAVLGFNPHSGENGLIGDTEMTLFSSLPREIKGPLVPDAAFLKKNWGLYSVFICLYHDQGLIPFKLQHGQDSGMQITLGLPFLRTSVDHGTAFSLFNKNVANANSMLEAIKFSTKITRS